MKILLLLLVLVYLTTGLAEANSSLKSPISDILVKNTLVENRGKKDGQMMHRVFMGLMLAKSMISMLLMFLSPIIQIKGLGISLVNVIINITRFIMQLKDRKEEPQPYKVHHIPAHHLPHYGHPQHDDIQDWSSSNSYAQYVQPNPSPYSNQVSGMEWSSSNQYKSFDSPVNTDNSYFPKRTESSSSWSSVPVSSELKTAEPNSETFSNRNLGSPTISLKTQNEKIS